MRVSEDRMQISISDNGTGFEPLERLAGNGLTNLRGRLEDLGGQCEITSSSGAGATVVLQLPLPIRPGLL